MERIMNLIAYKNINFTPYHHQQLGEMLSNKDVALGYGVSEKALSLTKSRNSDELIEGIHWLRIEVQTKGGKQKVIHWTLDGIHMLGFFIKSKEAKHFRKWAAKLLTHMKKRYEEKQNKNQPYIHQLERENIELKRAMNRLLLREDDKTLKEENKELKYEVDRLKFELVKIKDMLHDLAQNGFPLADTIYKLYRITNRFQTLDNIAKDGKNLNTDTKAGLEYWHKKYKEIIDEAYKAQKQKRGDQPRLC